jgi:Cd2+/Zn2+-exporting ATPase
LSPEQQTVIRAFNDEGKTVSVLVIGNKLAGAIAMRDEPRADALAGLKALTDAGIKTVMLTGDNARTAAAIGRQLGLDVRAELLPQDKLRIVGELKALGLKVAKVGDGINDAPALAAADIGIAMGGGTDVALETADAAVLHGRVGDVARMIELSKRTMGNIRQNITIALGLKAVFLVTTIIGITGLWPAILADTGATVLVTANALRLLMPDVCLIDGRTVNLDHLGHLGLPKRFLELRAAGLGLDIIDGMARHAVLLREFKIGPRFECRRRSRKLV